jgi:hypothetical protein
MPDYMYFDDNEDGTTTMRVCFEGEEGTMLVEMPFSDLLGMAMRLEGPQIEEMAREFEGVATVIPDTADEVM